MSGGPFFEEIVIMRPLDDGTDCRRWRSVEETSDGYHLYADEKIIAGRTKLLLVSDGRFGATLRVVPEIYVTENGCLEARYVRPAAITDALIQAGAEVRQPAEIARQGRRPRRVVVHVPGHQLLGQAQAGQVSQPMPAGKVPLRQGDHRDAHPQRVAGGHAAAERERVQRDIHLVVRPEVVTVRSEAAQLDVGWVDPH